jgi:transposase
VSGEARHDSTIVPGPSRAHVRAVEGGSSIRQAAARFEVSPSAAIKLMQRLRTTGSTAPAKIGGYRRPMLEGHEGLLRELTTARPGITLSEIKSALAERGIKAGHISTIWSTLRRLGLSHKKSH